MHPEMPLQQVEFALYRNDEHTISSSGYHSSNGGYIIKPDAYSGSVGVGFAETKNDVQAGVASCADVLAKETINPEMDGITIDQHVLVEQAIQRQEKLAGCAEFTAHYLSFAGKHHLLGIAEKTIHPSTFIETGHIFPSPSFPKDLVEILEATTTALLDELQVQNTLSNWEYIVTPDNCLVMVEGQLRPSGDHVMELMENAYTVSPYTMLCKAFKDGELDLSFSVQQTSSIYWLTPSICLSRILEVQFPADLPIGIHLHIDEPALKNAQNWQGPLSWYHRHISVITTATTAERCLHLCKEVLAQCILKGISADGAEQQASLLI